MSDLKTCKKGQILQCFLDGGEMEINIDCPGCGKIHKIFASTSGVRIEDEPKADPSRETEPIVDGQATRDIKEGEVIGLTKEEFMQVPRGGL